MVLLLLIKKRHRLADSLCGKALYGIYAFGHCVFYHRYFGWLPPAKHKIHLPAFRKVTSNAEAQAWILVGH